MFPFLSSRARRHRFLTLLLPLASKRQYRAARIEEWSNAERIGLTVHVPGHEIWLAIPRDGREFRCGNMVVNGRLAVCERVGEHTLRAAGLGITRLDAPGLKSIRRRHPKNVFVEQ